MIDRLASHPVNHRGLGAAKRDSTTTLQLDGPEELLRQLARLAMQRGQAVESQLVAELGDHVAVGRTVAPHGHRSLALRLAAEVNLAEMDQRLVHGHVVDVGSG